ncbi:MAG: hypothetical protein CBD26_03355 [Candidatus Pelagibacter sp. TMED166]|nr:MAG: hypothetical protein CBD26_03355 [Candidatus Pelagibacter sp. TMED166]
MVIKKKLVSKKTLGNRPMRKIVGAKVNNKKSDLLTKIDNKLEKIELEYGPVVYKELQTRLEKTIQIFNDEVESLFMQTFSTYKPSKTKGKNKEKAIKPKYISEYEKSKKS